MFYVSHRKAKGHYLYLYTETDSPTLRKLVYAWTLERHNATRFPTGEAAVKKIEELGIDPEEADWTSVHQDRPSRLPE